MAKFIGKLPDGTETTSTRRYIREWRALCRPVCDALELNLIGYDPGMLAKPRGMPTAHPMEFPTWFLKRLNKVLAGRDGK